MLLVRITIPLLLACIELVGCQNLRGNNVRSRGETSTFDDFDESAIDPLSRSIELNRTAKSVEKIKASTGKRTLVRAKLPTPVKINEDDSHDNEESSQDRVILGQQESHLKALEDMFDRRQASDRLRNNKAHQNTIHMQPASQELNPISIGLNPPVGPFRPVAYQPKMVDNIGGLGAPNLPFAFGQLPHLLGLQGSPGAPAGPTPSGGGPDEGSEDENGVQPDIEPRIGPNGQKIWPKIFRFTDGRANLAEFERQKKIRLSNMSHNGDNQVDPAPIMFDGRPLKRRSFLILHGGIFAR